LVILGIFLGLALALFFGHLLTKREYPRGVMNPNEIPFVDAESAWVALEGMRDILHKWGQVSIGTLADYAFGYDRESKGIDFNYTYGWTSIPKYCKPVKNGSVYTISGLLHPERLREGGGSGNG
jgi:hypothetical protein